MLKINQNGKVLGKDIHSTIESKTAQYNIWVARKIDDADLKEGTDFCTILYESTGGRPMRDYEFTLDAAKEICLLERNEKGKQIRRWLIDLSNQRENKDLLTHDEVVMLNILKNFFKYVENQTEITKLHLNKHVIESNSKGNKYAEFNVWRNNVLGIETSDLDAKIKAFCIENNRGLPIIKSNREKILFLNEYDALRNAVWDFLKIQGNINAEKLSNLAKRIAETERLQCFRTNETDLFRDKEIIDLSLTQNLIQ